MNKIYVFDLAELLIPSFKSKDVYLIDVRSNQLASPTSFNENSNTMT